MYKLFFLALSSSILHFQTAAALQSTTDEDEMLQRSQTHYLELYQQDQNMIDADRQLIKQNYDPNEAYAPPVKEQQMQRQQFEQQEQKIEDFKFN